jgi:hypothetical protein
MERRAAFRGCRATTGVSLEAIFAVVLTGPPGVGKTSVLGALVDALSDDDVAHAALEVEAVVWTHPALSADHWRTQVRSVCANHRAAGHRLLLVAHTLETDRDTDELLDAIGADEVLLVRLEARTGTLAGRLLEREPASWSGRDALVEHSQQLATTMPALTRVDLVLSTEGERAEDVAARIRAHRPDRLS